MSVGKPKVLMSEPARQYLKHKDIPALIESMVTTVMDQKPSNPAEFLATWLEGAAAAAPPPPPPPPPLSGFKQFMDRHLKKDENADKQAAARAALFADIAQGTDITKRLRKVSDSEKRHKNRSADEVGKATDFEELERSKAARQEELARKQQQQQQQQQKPKGTPEKKLEGKVWKINYQCGSRFEQLQDTLDEADMCHSVSIADCRDYYLTVTKKVNSVVITDCKNVCLMMEKDVVSFVEITKGSKVQVQACGKLPSFIMDRCDEVSLFTSADSRDVEITSCASTCANVTFVDEKGPEEDPIEKPIPEQFVTRIQVTDKGPKLVTQPMEHAG